MKVKVGQASGHTLNWMVAKCEGDDYIAESGVNGIGMEYEATDYTTDWSQGGPIIDREGIWTRTTDEGSEDPSCLWRAEQPYRSVEVGPTLLIAAMRCYVVSRLGEEVEVPHELV